MEEKDIYCKFTYKCGVCGKEFDNILDRAKCEIACAEKAEEEARRAAEAKKIEEKNVRKAEVDEAFVHLHSLITEFVKDYGHYEYDGESTNFTWPSKLYHRFWF